MKHFDPRSFYSGKEYRELTAELKEERRAWLRGFKGLNKDILGAI